MSRRQFWGLLLLALVVLVFEAYRGVALKRLGIPGVWEFEFYRPLPPHRRASETAPPIRQVPTPEASPTLPPTIAASEAPLSPITFQAFVAGTEDETLTQAQRDAFVSEQVGRRIEWDGYVQDVTRREISNEMRYLLVVGATEDMHDVAFCWFDRRWASDLLALKPGQKVAVSCTLQSYEPLGSRLDACSLRRM